jgi:hypothetical protein
MGKLIKVVNNKIKKLENEKSKVLANVKGGYAKYIQFNIDVF